MESTQQLPDHPTGLLTAGICILNFWIGAQNNQCPLFQMRGFLHLDLGILEFWNLGTFHRRQVEATITALDLEFGIWNCLAHNKKGLVRGLFYYWCVNAIVS